MIVSKFKEYYKIKRKYSEKYSNSSFNFENFYNKNGENNSIKKSKTYDYEINNLNKKPLNLNYGENIFKKKSEEIIPPDKGSYNCYYSYDDLLSNYKSSNNINFEENIGELDTSRINFEIYNRKDYIFGSKMKKNYN